MSGQALLAMWVRMAREHAADTLATIEEQRAARLAGRLEEYRRALSDLAGENGGHDASDPADI
ncbi:MAG: hypothetical protein JO168_10795 [Solirubrobacterales bacterium]|nr:hypothetical protein [Solirubrobacterales bacterium]